jgi:hypothetical protein
VERTLYYTFSTISQTLAGAIALLGAFVLYRLQSLGNELEDLGITTMNAYRSPLRDELTPLHAEEEYEKIVAFTHKHPFDDPSAQSPYVASRLRKLEPLVARRRAIRSWLNRSLALTVGLIAASVGILALTPSGVRTPGLACILLAVGWGWLILTFGSYTVLIKQTLK